jgi:formate hydrogenlyase subunit 3/multisubunit Na+/H+ antiporter MnhD subunit
MHSALTSVTATIFSLKYKNKRKKKEAQGFLFLQIMLGKIEMLNTQDCFFKGRDV